MAILKQINRKFTHSEAQYLYQSIRNWYREKMKFYCPAGNYELKARLFSTTLKVVIAELPIEKPALVLKLKFKYSNLYELKKLKYQKGHDYKDLLYHVRVWLKEMGYREDPLSTHIPNV